MVDSRIDLTSFFCFHTSLEASFSLFNVFGFLFCLEIFLGTQSSTNYSLSSLPRLQLFSTLINSLCFQGSFFPKLSFVLVVCVYPWMKLKSERKILVKSTLWILKATLRFTVGLLITQRRCKRSCVGLNSPPKAFVQLKNKKKLRKVRGDKTSTRTCLLSFTGCLL